MKLQVKALCASLFAMVVMFGIVIAVDYAAQSYDQSVNAGRTRIHSGGHGERRHVGANDKVNHPMSFFIIEGRTDPHSLQRGGSSTGKARLHPGVTGSAGCCRGSSYDGSMWIEQIRTSIHSDGRFGGQPAPRRGCSSCSWGGPSKSRLPNGQTTFSDRRGGINRVSFWFIPDMVRSGHQAPGPKTPRDRGKFGKSQDNRVQHV